MGTLLNNCDFNATSTGTGNFVVASNVTGHQTPALAGAVTGSVYRYFARNASLSEWEIGSGAYTVGSVTLARTTVLYNSAGTGTGAGQSGAGTKISFTTVPLVALVDLAEDLKPIFIVEGDSHSCNVGAIGTWPANAMALSGFWSRANFYDFALSGDTAALMVGEDATEAATIVIPSGAEAYYSLWAGQNDIVASTSAATIYGYLTTLWAAARARNCKVIAWTIMSRVSLSGAQEQARVDLNALIRAGSANYDFLIDADAMFPSYLNFLYFNTDAIHLTPFGNGIAAKAFARIVMGVDFTFAEPADVHAVGGIQLNGSSDISQYWGTSVITPGVAGADTHTLDGQRTQAVHGAGTAVLTVQQVLPPSTPFFGTAFKNCTKITATTAFTSPAAGDFVRHTYLVEGYDSARLGWSSNWGQPLTIAFGVYASIPGTFAVTARDGGGRAYLGTVTINTALTWEYKTITVPFDSALGGTWNTTNGVGIEIVLCFLGGSTYQGTANVWNTGNKFSTLGITNFFATNGNFVCVTGLMAIPGIYAPRADRWAFVQRTRRDELRRAQSRLFMVGDGVTNGIVHGSGVSLTTTDARIIIPVPEEMRAIPTLTTINPTHFSVSNGAGGNVAIATAAIVGGPRVQAIDVTVASGLTVGRSTYLLNTNADARLAFDARL